MRMKLDRKTIPFFLTFLLVFFATVALAQMRNVGPSMDMVNTQQIQVLRAELAKLRVELIACHDELNEVRKQLALCEKGTKAPPAKQDEEGSSSSGASETTNTDKSDSTPTP